MIRDDFTQPLFIHESFTGSWHHIRVLDKILCILPDFFSFSWSVFCSFLVISSLQGYQQTWSLASRAAAEEPQTKCKSMEVITLHQINFSQLEMREANERSGDQERSGSQTPLLLSSLNCLEISLCQGMKCNQSTC